MKTIRKYILVLKAALKVLILKKAFFKNDPIVERLLLKRKNIIHKTSNKIECFIFYLD
jgi:hypothetical protein